MKKIALLLHGSFSTPQDAWFPWMTQALTDIGYQVIAPEFPADRWDDVSNKDPNTLISKQSLNSWLATLGSIIDKNENFSPEVVIAHSLGPLFLLHAIQKFHFSVGHGYFVAPFFEVRGKSLFIEKVNETFYNSVFDQTMMCAYIRQSTVLYSTDDPYVDEEKSLQFASFLGSKVIKLSGLGHMGAEQGLTQFPHILDLINKNVQQSTDK